MTPDGFASIMPVSEARLAALFAFARWCSGEQELQGYGR